MLDDEERQEFPVFYLFSKYKGGDIRQSKPKNSLRTPLPRHRGEEGKKNMCINVGD